MQAVRPTAAPSRTQRHLATWFPLVMLVAACGPALNTVASDDAAPERSPPSGETAPYVGDRTDAPSPPPADEGQTPDNWRGISCELQQEHNDCFVTVPPELRGAAGPALVSRHEVSVSAFGACIASGVCSRTQLAPPGPLSTFGVDDKGDYPVNSVTYEGAQAVCTFLGGRLPTRAEWVTVAQAGDDRTWPWGNAPRCPRQEDVNKRAWPADIPPLAQTCGKMLSRLATEVTTAELDALGHRILAWPASAVVELCGKYGELPPGPMWPSLDKEVTQRASTFHASPPTSLCLREAAAPPSKLINVHPLGVMGLGGNVAEWTTDLDADQGAVVSGGSWMSVSWDELKIATTQSMPRQASSPDIGVRCVADQL
jgi:hypothetical protein